MSQFAYDFFAQSPVLALPVIALLVFFAVFVLIVVRAVRMKPSDADKYARIPLEDEGEARHG